MPPMARRRPSRIQSCQPLSPYLRPKTLETPMTRILACIILSLSLGGCLLTTAAQPIGQTSVDLQKGAYEAKLAYQGSLILAVAYIERPRCGHPVSPILCSQQSIVDTMRQA